MLMQPTRRLQQATLNSRHFLTTRNITSNTRLNTHHIHKRSIRIILLPRQHRLSTRSRRTNSTSHSSTRHQTRNAKVTLSGALNQPLPTRPRQLNTKTLSITDHHLMIHTIRLSTRQIPLLKQIHVLRLLLSLQLSKPRISTRNPRISLLNLARTPLPDPHEPRIPPA